MAVAGAVIDAGHLSCGGFADCGAAALCVPLVYWNSCTGCGDVRLPLKSKSLFRSGFMQLSGRTVIWELSRSAHTATQQKTLS